MLKLRIVLLCALIVACAVWIQWWASWDFPLSHPICGEGQTANDCPSYNVILFSAWRLAKAIDPWSVLITAAATVIVAVFTGTLYTINKSQLAHSHQVERAYISGGGGPETRTIQTPVVFGTTFSDPSPLERAPTTVTTGNFLLCVNNYGKTPGELWRVGINFCEADEVPEKPNYFIFDHHDWFGPGTMARPIRTLAIPKMTNPVVYGRFYYRDIFGANHSSGFINELGPERDGSTPLLAPAAYTEERNED